MGSVYINKQKIKNNDGYIDEYNEKKGGQNIPDNCIVCSYSGETFFDCYVCAKNPYKVASVSCHGHCNCFTKDPIKFTKIQKFFLKIMGVNFRYNERVK